MQGNRSCGPAYSSARVAGWVILEPTHPTYTGMVEGVFLFVRQVAHISPKLVLITQECVLWEVRVRNQIGWALHTRISQFVTVALALKCASQSR